MSDYTKRTIIKEEVPSSYLQASRAVKVYLPPGYNELLSYPVVYCQDGSDFFTMGRIATIANELILSEGMEPFLIAGVSVERSKRTSEYSAVGERNEAYKRFFAEELVPYMESRYPVSDRTRVIAGDSLGGTVSLHLALDYPELFCNVLSLSGAFLEPTLDALQVEADLSWLNLWMIIGLEETSVETHMGNIDFVQFNREAKRAFEQKKARLHYIEKPGVHTWGFWQKELPHGLRYFFPTHGL